MKLKLDFSKIAPTQKQIEYAMAIHWAIHDGLTHQEMLKVLTSASDTNAYLDKFADIYQLACAVRPRKEPMLDSILSDSWFADYI